jgi:hypothetical protein
MRVRVAYTIDVPDDFRRAVACYYGEHGQKLSRERLQRLFQSVGSSQDADIIQEWNDCEVCHPGLLDDADAMAAGNFV